MVMSNYAGLRFHLCHGWREVRRCIFLLVLSSFSQNRCWKGSFASYCTALSSTCPAPLKRFTWGNLDSQQNPRPRLLSRLLCHLRGTCKQLPKARPLGAQVGRKPVWLNMGERQLKKQKYFSIFKFYPYRSEPFLSNIQHHCRGIVL